MILRLLFVSESIRSVIGVVAMKSGYCKRLTRFGTGAFMLLAFQCVCAGLGPGRLQPLGHNANGSWSVAIADRALDD